MNVFPVTWLNNKEINSVETRVRDCRVNDEIISHSSRPIAWLNATQTRDAFSGNFARNAPNQRYSPITSLTVGNLSAKAVAWNTFFIRNNKKMSYFVGIKKGWSFLLSLGDFADIWSGNPGSYSLRIKFEHWKILAKLAQRNKIKQIESKR